MHASATTRIGSERLRQGEHSVEKNVMGGSNQAKSTSNTACSSTTFIDNNKKNDKTSIGKTIKEWDVNAHTSNKKRKQSSADAIACSFVNSKKAMAKKTTTEPSASTSSSSPKTALTVQKTK